MEEVLEASSGKDVVAVVKQDVNTWVCFDQMK